MPDSIPIPLDLLTETRDALDAALLCAQDSPEAYGKVLRAKANLGECLSKTCDKIPPDKRQTGYLMLRKLEELKREIKKDYGLEK
jgi:hypothetical protein